MKLTGQTPVNRLECTRYTSIPNVGGFWLAIRAFALQARPVLAFDRRARFWSSSSVLPCIEEANSGTRTFTLCSGIRQTTPNDTKRYQTIPNNALYYVAVNSTISWKRVDPSKFDASRRGKKELKYSRDKNTRHEPWWGGGRRASYVTPDLSYDYCCRREREKKGEYIINRMEKKYKINVALPTVSRVVRTLHAYLACGPR